MHVCRARVRNPSRAWRGKKAISLDGGDIDSSDGGRRASSTLHVNCNLKNMKREKKKTLERTIMVYMGCSYRRAID